MSDRRQSNDRRTHPGRRQNIRRRTPEGRTLFVELGESEIHVALLSQEPQASADTLSTSSGAWTTEPKGRLASREGVAALGRALRDATARHGAAGATLHVLLGGAYCTTRVVRGSNDEVRSELAQIEQRSRFYLALGPGQKTVVSAVRQLDGRRQYAQTLVCNQATLDALSQAAEAAGLTLVCVEASLVAMSRAMARVADAPQNPHLLLHLSERSIEIGICQQGDLLFDYRPSNVRRPEEIAQVVKEHLPRLRRFVAIRRAPVQCGLSAARTTLLSCHACGRKPSAGRIMQSYGRGDYSGARR